MPAAPGSPSCRPASSEPASSSGSSRSCWPWAFTTPERETGCNCRLPSSSWRSGGKRMQFGPLLYPTAAKEFLATVKPTTAQTWRSQLRALQDRYPDARVERFTESMLLTYLQEEKRRRLASGKVLAENTLRAKRSAIIAFLRWAALEGLVAEDRNPAVRLKERFPCGTAPEREGTWLDAPQVRQLVRNCQGEDPRSFRDLVVIMLAFFTGLRLFELVALTWGDLHELDGEEPYLWFAGKGH